MTEFWIGLVKTTDDIGEPDWFAATYATEAEARASLLDEYDEDEVLDSKVVRMTTSYLADAAEALSSAPHTVSNIVCPEIPWLAAVPDGGTWDLDAHNRRLRENGHDPIPEGTD